VHNGADATQNIGPAGDETKTCSDKLHAQSGWTANAVDPATITPPPEAFQSLTYAVWKAPAGFSFEDAQPVDSDGDGNTDGYEFFDSATNTTLPAIQLSGFSTGNRTLVDPPEGLFTVPAGAENLWLFTRVEFTATLTGVAPGDSLGLRPVNSEALLILTAVACSPQPVTARIDVLPGSSTNVIHPKVNTPLIPVLVYGSNALHVRSIVKSSVRLKNAPAAAVSTTQSRPFDADHDGKLDRRYYFSPVKTGITCGETSVTLTGRTKTGIHFTGTNPIRTVC
jgi:hypothetical protein